MELEYYRHQKNVHAITIPKQNIQFTEVTIVLSGELHYKWNGIPYILKKGDAIFAKGPGIRERTSPDIRSTYISINYTDEKMWDLPIYLPQIVDSQTGLLLDFLDISFQNSHQVFSSEMVKGVEALLEHFKCILQKSPESFITKEIKQYVQENIRNDISLNEISQNISYSRSRMEGYFKKDTGMSIMEYVISERIKQAQLLLREGVLPLKSIASMVGISDYNYFVRLYRKKTGDTPLSYRKKYIK